MERELDSPGCGPMGECSKRDYAAIEICATLFAETMGNPQLSKIMAEKATKSGVDVCDVVAGAAVKQANALMTRLHAGRLS